MSKKTIAIVLIALIMIIFSIGTVLSLKKNDKTQTPRQTQQAVENQPNVEGENSLKSCAVTRVCEEGYFCYKSRYGAMGENGPVTGEEQGDLLCHKKCINDIDCSTGECLDVEIMSGDLVYTEKFCSDE